ncbi:MAG: hypothetical protein ACRD2A_24845, partial [Vicinamibacterales bacterium]
MQAALLREFVSRLPDGRDAQEELIFRGILLQVVIAWATHLHIQFHKSRPAACEFAPIEELWKHWRGEALTSKLAFA